MMKKLVLTLAFFALGFSATSLQAESMIDSDFRDGVPDGWETENVSHIEERDGSVRFYASDDTSERSKIYIDYSAPDAQYEFYVDYFKFTTLEVSDPDAQFEWEYTDGSLWDTYDLDNEMEDTTIPENEFGGDDQPDSGRIAITWKGGTNYTTGDTDYFEVSFFEMNMVEDSSSFDYHYDLDDYYFLQYEVSQDEINSGDFVSPTYGNPDYVTDRRLAKSNVVVENEGSGEETHIFSRGTVYDDSFNEADNFVNTYEITNWQMILENDDGVYPEFISFVYHGEYNPSAETGDIRVQNIDLDTDDDTMNVYLYVPKEESSGIGVEDPDQELAPEGDNIPEGLPQVLTYFGLWNFAGIMALFAFIIITVNVALVFMGVKNMGLIMVDVMIYGLFAFMGLLMLVHHIIIVSAFILTFVVVMKGGGAVE